MFSLKQENLWFIKDEHLQAGVICKPLGSRATEFLMAFSVFEVAKNINSWLQTKP